MVSKAPLFVVATFFLFVGAGPLPSPFAEELKIAAVVNDEVITQAELNRALAPILLQLQATHEPEELAAELNDVRGKVLQQLIEERLMLQEALNPHPVEVAKGKIGTPPPISVSEAEIEEILLATQARFESPEAFAQALSQQGLTLEELRSRFRDQIAIEKLIHRQIQSRITVSPSEVTAYYGSHPEEFVTPEAVQTALLLIQPKDTLGLAQAKSLAEDLRRQLATGADFYELAKRYSDGPNAKMGGRLGFLEKGKGLPEIDRALFSLKAGEISPVIRTAVGFHIFRIESVRPARRLTLEEAQEKIQQRLFQEKTAARYREWIDKLKADSYISIP